MKLLLKQRVFSWFDSYDIYNEQNEVIFIVKGQLSWGHRLIIYDAFMQPIGEIKEEVLTFLPLFRLYDAGVEIGQIKKEFSFFQPKFHLSMNDWEVHGDIWEWEYEVDSLTRGRIMTISKELFHFSDTYVLDIYNSKDALYCLMIVLAIDAIKCSKNN